MGLSDRRQMSNRRTPGRSRRGWWLGYLAALLTHRSQGRRHPIGAADLKRHDLTASTQRLGLRFSERIRDVFRHRWLRKAD